MRRPLGFEFELLCNGIAQLHFEAGKISAFDDIKRTKISLSGKSQYTCFFNMSPVRPSRQSRKQHDEGRKNFIHWLASKITWVRNANLIKQSLDVLSTLFGGHQHNIAIAHDDQVIDTQERHNSTIALHDIAIGIERNNLA